jgi:hypothetical protein
VNLVSIQKNDRTFHIYQFLQKKLNDQKLEIHFIKPNISLLFRSAKSSLDLGAEVLICDSLNESWNIEKFHQKHFINQSNQYLYLNISLKNKIVEFFSQEISINNITELQDNISKSSLFSE